MSSLLNEAIVDAKALREAALKNAETIVIEKYSDEVRQTLEQLLEQEEEMIDPAADPLAADPLAADPAADPMAAADPAAMPMEEGEEAAEEITEEDIPLAATDDFAELDGKNLDQLSAGGEEVELNLNLGALQESVSKLMEETEEEYDLNEDILAALLKEDIEENLMPDGEGGFIDTEAEQQATDDKKGRAKRTQRNPTGKVTEEDKPDGDGDGVPPWADADEKDPEVQEESIDLDSLANAIMEKLTVDMGADLSGWAGRSSAEMKHEIEKELAHRRSTDVQEELEDLKKAQEELVFENSQLNEHNNQYKQALQELKENLQDVNLSNARLLYTNRVLRNTSLNERQKEKIVEAISSAGSVTEARTIYETLQSTVEAAPNRKSPQSLSEAIGRRSTVLRATRKEAPSNAPFQDRMKRLAGIK